MRKITAAAIAAAALLFVPSVAQADYHIDADTAVEYAEDFVMDKYGSEYPGAYCRPQGRRAPRTGYIYHRWVCYWADEYKCEGKIMIVGSRPANRYYAKVLRGQRCP